MERKRQDGAAEAQAMETARERVLDDDTALRLVREEAGHVMVVMDTFSVIHHVSPNVRPLLGHEPADLVGRSIIDLSPPEDLERLADAHGSVLQGDAIVLARQRLRDGRGAWTWVETTSRRAHRGDSRWIVCTIRREPGAPEQAAWSKDR